MSTGEPQQAHDQSVGLQATEPPMVASQVRNPMKRPVMRIIDIGGSLALLVMFVTLGLVQNWDRAWELTVPFVLLFIGLQMTVGAVITANYLGDGRRGMIMMFGVFALVLSGVAFFQHY